MKDFQYIPRVFKHAFILLILTGLIQACVSNKMRDIPADNTKPVTIEELVVTPFTFAPTVKNFSNSLKHFYKLQVYTVKNRFITTQTDTIFRFYRKKSELFIYKANKKEFIMASMIYDDKIVLRNGIKVGITRYNFQKSFINMPVNKKDTVRLTSKKTMNSLSFVFRNRKLFAIKIDNYLDY